MVIIVELAIGTILIGTLLLIMSERVDKTLAAMLGAGFALLIAIIPGSAGADVPLIPDVEHLFEFLELDLLLVIIGVTLMVGTARKTGLFEYVSILVLKRYGRNQYTLLTALSFLTLLFSAFLDAYMAIIIIGSITLVSCESLDINPKPYILAEAIFGNLGGTMTRIASPPNLIIGGHFNIDFVTFFVVTAPYVVFATITTLFIWRILFKKEFDVPIEKHNYNELLLVDERTLITDMSSFKIAAAILLLTTAGFAISSFLPLKLELGYIAMAGGFAMVGLVKANLHEAFTNVEWSLVFFLVGLLAVIGISEKTGVLEFIVAPIEVLFSFNLLGGVLLLQWINAFTSAVLDNVAMASIMTSIMDQLVIDYPTLPFFPLLVSVVIGTNLGGNITPIGSASTVQAVEILKRTEEKSRVSFQEFIKFGFLVTIPQLILGSIYIVLIWVLSLLIGA